MTQKGKTMETNVTTDDIAKALAHGQHKLGALVYWNGLTDVRIDRALFRQGFRIAGLGRAVQRDPRPEAVLTHAVTIAQRRQGRVDEKARVELKAKGTHSTYAVLMRRDVGDQRRYIEEARIAVPRGDSGAAATTAPIVEYATAVIDDQCQALVDAVLEQYTELAAYVGTQETSETLMRAMGHAGALSLRSGIYFVPAAALDGIRLLKTFLEQNTRAALTVWDIAATAENAGTAKRDAREAFQDRLTALVAEVTAFTAENSDPDAANAKSVNARVRRFGDLDGRVSLWADVLGDHVAELRAAIAAAKSSLLGAYMSQVDDGDLSPISDDAEAA